MKSLTKLYQVGPGPSSSHTIAPARIAKLFKENIKNPARFKVILYGSLAYTGKGHLTDYILKKTFAPIKCDVEFCNEFVEHPNTLDLLAYDQNGDVIDNWRAYSTGGGDFLIKGKEKDIPDDIYPHNTITEINKYIEDNNLDYASYVYQFEDKDFKDYLKKLFFIMCTTIENGLKKEGILQGGLNLERIGKKMFNLSKSEEDPKRLLLLSFAYATSEESASGELVITSPTCGASGVLPSLLYYYYKYENVQLEKIIDSMAVAGLFGNIVKHRASISGAEAGCQAEVGVACAMGAVAVSYINDLSINSIEYSAEIALEHHLGLTCDPVLGLVQIPCIERNAVATLRALDAMYLSKNLSIINKRNRVSFDDVISVMLETGTAIIPELKETSIGGLARRIK